MSNYEHIQLRLRYPGHPSIALVDGLNKRHEFNRVWCADYLLFDRRERKSNGSQEQVYALPLIDAIYEIREMRDGVRVQRYIATREKDIYLYTLTRGQVDRIAEGTSTVQLEISKNMMTRIPMNSNNTISKENGNAQASR